MPAPFLDSSRHPAPREEQSTSQGRSYGISPPDSLQCGEPPERPHIFRIVDEHGVEREVSPGPVSTPSRTDEGLASSVAGEAE